MLLIGPPRSGVPTSERPVAKSPIRPGCELRDARRRVRERVEHVRERVGAVDGAESPRVPAPLPQVPVPQVLFCEFGVKPPALVGR